MPHKKGHTNNPAGRTVGSKNKKTQQWEQLGEFITQKGAERAMTILDKLEDESYLEQYNKLLNYFKPRMQSAQVETKGEININIVEPD